MTPIKTIWPDFCIVYPIDSFQNHMTWYLFFFYRKRPLFGNRPISTSLVFGIFSENARKCMHFQENAWKCAYFERPLAARVIFSFIDLLFILFGLLHRQRTPHGHQAQWCVKFQFRWWWTLQKKLEVGILLFQVILN